MFRIESVIQLKEEEEIQAMVRRHLFTVMPSLFLAMLLIVIPFFLLFPLFSIGLTGVIIFGVTVIVGILWAIRTFILWHADVLIITNLRIVDVDQRGLLSRKVTEAPFENIQDVSWKREGMAQTIFRMGSVEVQTAGASAKIEAHNIPYPQKVHELINDLKGRAPEIKEETKQSPEKKDRRSRIRHIAEMLDDVEDETVQEVERMLEKKAKNKAMEKLFDKSEEDSDD
ncbi:MAG: PH domain-containing protein [Patescibacteria group bacterium]